MTILINPFVTSGYVSPGYFCDRQTEREQLIREISNGNNLALISTRRMGKSGLIGYCFGNESIACPYYTFFVDRIFGFLRCEGNSGIILKCYSGF